jgi:hypothetical protein
MIMTAALIGWWLWSLLQLNDDYNQGLQLDDYDRGSNRVIIVIAATSGWLNRATIGWLCRVQVVAAIGWIMIVAVISW